MIKGHNCGHNNYFTAVETNSQYSSASMLERGKKRSKADRKSSKSFLLCKLEFTPDSNLNYLFVVTLKLALQEFC